MENSNLPYILLESETFSDITVPLKSSNRIKYTCFTVSQSFVIFGATSGGLYVFHREPFTFSQLLPNKEGAISFVAVSPNENLIAFATLKGIVGVLERNEGLGARMINRSSEHTDSEITALEWSENNLQVFVGDKNGKVSVLNLTSAMSKTMFQVPTFTLMQLDSQIVQLSCHSGLLLVSTLTRCYICDTVKEQYKQVGQKLRDGEFGACFISINDSLKLFCARPGSRLWKVNTDGVVENTYELKKALAVPPASVVSLSDEPKIITSSANAWTNQSVNFNKLLIMLNRYLVTFKEDGIYLFNVDDNVSVLFWSDYIKNISDFICIGDTVYMYSVTGELNALKIMSLDKCLLRLFYKNMFTLCAELCVLHLDTLLNWDKIVYLYHIKELENHLTEINEYTLCKQLKSLFDKLNQIDYSPISKLDSGIFLVDNYHLNSQFVEKGSSLYSSHLRLKRNKMRHSKRRKRSQSLSLISKKKSLQRNQISASLPNLTESIKISEDYVVVGDRNEADDLHQHYSDESSGFNPNNIPFPFLMLAAPDAIHDAIVELGSNVTERLVDGTRSLHEKWQILEGKFRLLKPDLNNEESSVDERYFNNHTGISRIPDFDETDSIVDRPRKKRSHLPDLDISKMTKICEELDSQLEDDLSTDLVFEFFNEIVSSFSEFQSKVKKLRSMTNLPNSQFPFSRYFKEKEIAIMQRIFHEALKSKILVKWFQDNSAALKNLNFKKFSYPNLLTDFHPENEIFLDENVSNMLSIFAEVLDPFIILQCLHCASMNCSYQSFCTVLQRFQNGDLQLVANNKQCSDVNHAEWPLPLLLNTMFLMLRLDQIETSSQMGIEGNVSTRYIVYIVLKLKMHLVSTGVDILEARHKCHILFLSYISRLLANSHTIKLNDDIVIAFILNSFLSTNSSSNFNSCFNCCFPSFSSNLPILKFAEIGYLIIDHFWSSHLRLTASNSTSTNTSCNNVTSNSVTFTEIKAILNFDTEKEAKKKKLIKLLSKNVTTSLREIIAVCVCVPRLWKYLLSTNDIIAHIPSAVSLMVQLNLITKSKNMLAVKNINLFEKIIILNIICKKGICLNCGVKNKFVNSINYGVSWTELCCIILKFIDSKTTVELLMKYCDEIPSASLDLRVYQCAILSSMVDAHQTGLRQIVVDRVTSLSKGLSGIPVFSPDVAAAFDTAVRLDVNNDFSYQKSDEESAETHHWGVKIDLAEEFCHLCSLSLGAKALIAANNGGLIAFKCGHSYHAVCLKHQNNHATVCTLCYSS